MEKLTKAEKKILLKLASMGPVTATKISEDLDIHRVYAVNRLRVLSEAGLVVRTETVTLYEISTEGIDFLKKLEEA